ncbi:hypothetical protein EDB84DRAFT_62661 [Lactarius hengduanensis]|nr:hypothetical protein EDB84DRAFT_62661 [Lactarius hengduanensis]
MEGKEGAKGRTVELSGMGKGNVVQCLRGNLPFFWWMNCKMRSSSRENSQISRHQPTEMVLFHAQYHPSSCTAASTRLCSAEAEACLHTIVVNTNLCHIRWSQGGADYCAIGYHTACEQSKCGTTYAWYTGVINRKAEKKKKLAREIPPKG